FSRQTLRSSGSSSRARAPQSQVRARRSTSFESDLFNVVAASLRRGARAILPETWRHSAVATALHVGREKIREDWRHISHKKLRKKSIAKKSCHEQRDGHT